MQDWEWEVADHERIDEFMAPWRAGAFDENERIAMVEILMQPFADLKEPLAEDKRWQEFLGWIEADIHFFLYTVYYWASVGNEGLEEAWIVAPFMRALLWKYRPDIARIIRKPDQPGEIDDEIRAILRYVFGPFDVSGDYDDDIGHIDIKLRAEGDTADEIADYLERAFIGMVDLEPSPRRQALCRQAADRLVELRDRLADN